MNKIRYPSQNGTSRRLAAVVVLALLGICALFGSVASSSGGKTQFNPGITGELLTVALTLAGLGGIYIVGLLLWAALGASGGDNAPPETAASRWAHRAVAVLIVGAFIGLVALLRLARGHAQPVHEASHTAPPPGAAVAHSTAVRFHAGASIATIVAVVVLVALLVLWRLWRHGGRLHLRNLKDLFSAQSLHPGHVDPMELAASIDELRIADPLEEADPRRAVVAAYVAMTSALGASGAGAARASSETASEYLGRLLTAVGVSEGAAHRLTYLFEIARYSDLAVDESLRSNAIKALEHIRAELRDRADLADAGAPRGRVVP